MKPQQYRFLTLNRDAQRKAIGLAAETEFQHPEPLSRGASIPVHAHAEDNIYFVTGRARFTVYGADGNTVLESRFIGDGEECNAVYIPGGILHGWDDATEGTRIYDVQYENRIERVLPEAICA